MEPSAWLASPGVYPNWVQTVALRVCQVRHAGSATLHACCVRKATTRPNLEPVIAKAATLCSLVLPAVAAQAAPRSASAPKALFLRPDVGCLNCPDGLVCPSGNDQPLQQAGFWALTIDSTQRIYSVIACRNIYECPEGAVGSCAEGREGPACDNCKLAYYTADLGTCKPCKNEDALLFVFTVVIVILMCGALALIVNVDVAKQRLSFVTVVITFGHLASTVQALGVFQRLAINWIEPIKSALAIVGLLTFDFDVIKITCIFQQDSPVMQFAFRLLVYPCFVVVLVLTMGLRQCCGRRLEFDALFNLNGLVLLVAYIPLTMSVLLPFQCVPNPNGTSSTGDNPGVICWSSTEHRWLACLGGIGILCYPVAILAHAVSITLRYPSFDYFRAWLAAREEISFFV